MLFDVAALWLIVWMFKNAAMDVMYAGSGKPNPRYELKKAKARAAGQPDPVQHRYGSRDWFADLLSDGLQAQTDWRRRKAAEKRQARELAEAEPDGDGPDGAGGRPVGDPVAKPGVRPAGDDQEPGVPDGFVHANSSYITQEGAGKWSWTCRKPACPGKGFDYDTQEQAQDGARQHRCVTSAAGNQTSEPGAGGAPDPEQPQSPRPTAAPDNRPDAKVIPFRTTKPQEEPVSTDVNSEVIGLDQSIAYARSLATFAGEHGQAGNEGYIGHLTTAKVEGAALQTAAEMQEAFANAAAAAEAHAGELEKQKAVQEAFDANPDAGDKEFQTEGR
ncbi:hypothetical protein ACQP2Y_46730 (plasmid) [Actinoplanes sp. CA-051413]|uniref:hypothetical protein n=1 Tax=Actinoplanes sp. CA-051413 TaxID=3239899 RepID=UPI003D954664